MTFTQPDVRPISDKNGTVLYKLQEDYVVHVYCKRINEKLTIKVPKGYVTDLASIPSWLWSLFRVSPDGLQRAATLVHDYIYGLHLKGTDYSLIPRVDDGWYRLYRQDCDRIMRELMEDTTDTQFHIKAFFWAVETFGWLRY